MKFLHPSHDSELELALEDVFIVPKFFEGNSRSEIDLSPHDFLGSSHPIVTSNMSAVTGKRMAETIARYGGLGILPQDMSLPTVERIVKHVKNAPLKWDTALTVTPDASLRDVEGILYKRSHDLVIVVDDHNKLIGIITSADLKDKDQFTKVSSIMSRSVVTVDPNFSSKEAFLKMEEARVKAAPVIDAHGRVLGTLTKEDSLRLALIKPSIKEGRLMIGAAFGVNSDKDKARALLDLGVDFLVLDTAHGHQEKMVQALKACRSVLGPQRDIPLIAGNVCTREGTRDLIQAGADIIKVNIGPGAMCTTRMQTGVGRPSFSAVKACAEEAKKHGAHIWADGGCRHPRDIALYLAAGASRVVVGTWLAGTFESPGDIKKDQEGRPYKVNYGMASGRAVGERTSELDSFERAKKGFFREGISTSKIYLKKGQDSVGSILIDIITGVRSSFSYANASSIEDFEEKVEIGVQTKAGYEEGTPHGQVR